MGSCPNTVRLLRSYRHLLDLRGNWDVDQKTRKRSFRSVLAPEVMFGFKLWSFLDASTTVKTSTFIYMYIPKRMVYDLWDRII